MNPSETPANLQDQIADLFYSSAKALDRLREALAAGITDAEDEQMVEFARQLRHYGDEFNAEAARERLAAVQGALADLAKVTAQVKQQLKTVLLVQHVICIAEALIGLGEAIATGSLSGVGSALGNVAKAVGPLVEKAGAGGDPAPGASE